MNQSLRNDLRAVWLVRSRILRMDLGFWMILLGYDLKLKRFTNRLYLVYALIFFALWIFVVLTLLADYGARGLKLLPLSSPLASAVLIGVLSLSGLFLVELFQAARRSPFTFSDEDALHFCMTPLDRRLVCLEWLLEAWARSELAVGAVSIVLAYSLVEALASHPLTPADLPMYILAGVRMFLVAAPLYLALKSIAWAAGAWRLRGMREPGNLRWVSPVLVLIVGGGLVLGGPQSLVAILAPLSLALQAGLGQAPWSVGLAIGLVTAALGIAVLWRVSAATSLARAAQETRDRQVVQAAVITGQAELANELAQQKRLRGEQLPSRIPTGTGVAALLWKNVVQTQRLFRLTDLLPWLGLFGLALSFVMLPNWGTRAWSLVMWVLFSEQQMVRPLRRELARWWIIRQMPFRSELRVTAMLALPVARVWLAGFSGLAAAVLLGVRVSPVVFWLYLVSVPCVGFAAAWHVLQRSKTQELIAGRVPDVGLLGVLLGALALGLNGLFAWLAQGLPDSIAFLVLVGEGAGVLYLFWLAVGAQMRGLK
ncbi:MAG: hypothetical protein IH586_23710 [Anaerolineaceae bacterium]|nr:hypothetical protein [Anaerolineaceae bacterium]